MLQALSRHPKLIAWSMVVLFYLDLILVPVSVKGESVAARSYKIIPRLSWQEHFAQQQQANRQFKNSLPAPVVAAPTQPAGNDQSFKPDDRPFSGGPGQPEMSAFTSVNASNMVDLFSGDFSYNIPLLDVGGYPVNLAYRGGVSMDEDASWVGLGWNINPGTITRNMRGLPDDFDGKNDSVKKVMSIRDNKTIGVTGGADIEIAGFPQNEQNKVDSNAIYQGIGVGASLGIFHNTYRGWGIEHGLNASINAGTSAKGPLSGGLSFTNNSQEGLTIAPSLSLELWRHTYEETGSSGMFTIGLPYNSRGGLKGLQLSTGVRQFSRDNDNQTRGYGETFASAISFVAPTFTPTISIPYTSTQFTFTGKVGLEKKVYHPSFFLSGYVSTQSIAEADTLLALPAYGYLNFTKGARNRGALLDFNREKDMPYREKPAVPHIGLPAYTYDAFSITGEGTGGMFRAYRGDIGFIHDHNMRTKDNSERLSVDVGVGDLTHGGVDVNVNRAFTQTGAWIGSNPVSRSIDFRESDGFFESVYFRNPGEKSINPKAFYDATGGDDLVAVMLYQAGRSSSIQTSNYLARYRNKRAIDTIRLTPASTVKQERDKRSQVISYVTAKEADAGAALTKYIESYTVNQFNPVICGDAIFDSVEGLGIGLPALYYPAKDFSGVPFSRVDPRLDFNLFFLQRLDIPKYPPLNANFPRDKFSIRWQGRIMAPVTGTYELYMRSDDGVRIWVNDSLFLNNYRDKPMDKEDTVRLNLLENHLYDIRIDYYENLERAGIQLDWSYPGQVRQRIPHTVLYPPPHVDTFRVNNFLVKEKRVNKFRKENHISEINVLNTDGRRYVYGIPVYNLKQKDKTFSVDHSRGNAANGTVHYSPAKKDNTAKNQNGRDWYYNSEEVPAYAHSFLLSGILSADYSDVTGNGISDDDIGDAVKFNYSKICGINNPFRWRAPQIDTGATYNEGLKTDHMDDKGNYVYGEKELWYLHSIESKTMIATFVVEGRADLFTIDENGRKISNAAARRLREINLYTKAEFMKRGTGARPVKTVNFHYGYDLCTGVNGDESGKLTLKKVWFTYNGNNKDTLNPYIFNYSSKNPGYNIKSYDRWGNYKDPLQNPGSHVGNLISNAEYPYALQDSLMAAQNASAWMLDSIHLPSGGSIKVNYESDDYAYVQNKRAMQFFKVAGFGATPGSVASYELYRKIKKGEWRDNLYVFVKVSQPVSNALDVYRKYLADVTKLYFRLYVRMPDDESGSGSEYINTYANLSSSNSYGMVNSTTIWIKIDGISLKGDEPGNYSPLAKTAIQFLRLNLPSKAYPGSQNMGALDLRMAVEAVAALGDNIKNAFRSFDAIARDNVWACQIDTSRSMVRLNNPVYKKYGGGYRVKRVVIYDNWNKMTGQRGATYGQEYTYTTQQEINGVSTTISSGVASYEPMLGGEENPFRVPIEYVESVAPLGPTTLGYSEEPLGESFYPSAGVGYSCVRTRTIHYKDRKSANGYEETKFYTAYDFPVYTDRTMIDDDTKKRFRPELSNFLRINARHHVAVSQGFKIELNDMHGKLRSKATYAETDPKNYVSYSENIYRVENSAPGARRLSNTVMAIHPDGRIDTTALIGKDVEMMVDMREQRSITNGYNVHLNSDMFTIPMSPGFFLLPTFLNLAQREENLYRSAATVKIIQRYGILDSVIAVDKGSMVSTKDILYDAETGDVVLTRTQNEFNDFVYNFTYPGHWAYDGMGMAYRNIGLTLEHVNIRDGKIISGLNRHDSAYFSSGDEIFVAGKLKTGDNAPCLDHYSTFPSYDKIWAIDSSVLTGGVKNFYFVDRQGKAYNAYDVTLKIIRSGRRNIFGAVGSVTSLESPIKRDVVTGNYELVLDSNSRAVAAGAASFKQFWKTEDIKRSLDTTTCVNFQPEECEGDTSCTCKCLRSLFDYLIQSKRLFIKDTQNVTVSSLVNDANTAGFGVATCDLLEKNAGGKFYSLTTDSISHIYKAKIGDCIVSFFSQDTTRVNFYQLQSEDCDENGYVTYSGQTSAGGDTITRTFYPRQQIIVFERGHFFYQYNTNSKNILAYKGPILNYYIGPDTQITGGIGNRTYINFDSIDVIEVNSKIISATLNLFASSGGFNDSAANAHTVTDSMMLFVPVFSWNTTDNRPEGIGTPQWDTTLIANTTHQNYSFSAKEIVEKWIDGYPAYTGLGFDAYRYDADDTTYFTFASYLHPNAALRPSLTVTYVQPDSSTIYNARLFVESCDSCHTIAGTICESLVTDTAFNPYVLGVLGNWRSDRSYVYYSGRTETDPTTATTDIRRFGTIDKFKPYWTFAGDKLVTDVDTMRWVWNSETTQFNRKGFEIENKDPLGRYNSVLYGYNNTLPVAVTQNSRYRESAFEGFEDYDFVTQICEKPCASSRHIDYAAHTARFDTVQRHSGKASLKLTGGADVSLTFALGADSIDAIVPKINFALMNDTCSTDGRVLHSIRTNEQILQSMFSPIPGKRMVLSAWVKEDQDCKCVTYTNNRIVVAFPGSATGGINLAPTGTIIEGWQRYESFFTIPADATGLSVSLESTNSGVNVYFDDLRIHPYNANMKSFVFHPVNLRLMAELDENNYATFYEYDDDGTLIRLKKETQRGIKLIRETRSALLKEQQ